MPSNQNPVFTDNTTILGDGTVENPLTAASSGGISEVESTNGSISVTDGGGPTVNLSVSSLLLQVAAAAGPVINSGDGSFQDVIDIVTNLPGAGWGVLCKASFVHTPATGCTQILWKFVDKTASTNIGRDGGLTVQVADGTTFYSGEWMAFESGSFTSGDTIALQASCAGAGATFTDISIAILLIPPGF